jgi:hypothetical protein
MYFIIGFIFSVGYFADDLDSVVTISQGFRLLVGVCLLTLLWPLMLGFIARDVIVK